MESINAQNNGVNVTPANKVAGAGRPRLSLRSGRAISTTSSLPSLYHDGALVDDEEDTEEVATGANTDVEDDGYDSHPGEDDLDVARREAWFSSALASAMIESPREVELIRSWRSAIDDDHLSPKAKDADDGVAADRMVTFQDLGARHTDLASLTNATPALLTPEGPRKSVSFGVAEVVEDPDYFSLPNGAPGSLSRSSSVSKSCLRSRTSSMSEGQNANGTSSNEALHRLTTINEPVEK